MLIHVVCLVAGIFITLAALTVIVAMAVRDYREWRGGK